MKNSQKGFIVPLVVAIVTLVISGSIYFYFKNTQFSQMDSTQASVSSQNIPAEQATNQAKPVISLISPASTTPQTLVTITGSGFVGNNDIKFTSISQPAIVAYACGVRAKNNNTSILFGSGPSSQDPFVSDCKGGIGVKGIVLQSGLYNVSVINNNGVSNSVSYTIASPVAQVDETADWQTHINKIIGFSFKYPQGWRVDDSFSFDTRTGYLMGSFSLYSSATPFTEPPLREGVKQNVMSAWFSNNGYENNHLVYGKQDYINNLPKSVIDVAFDVNMSSISSIKNGSGLDIIKFECIYGGDGGGNHWCYTIPKKSDFSEVINVVVRNHNSMFEKVLSTFKFISSVGE